ncbi:hypothetical protein D3C72_2426760 [compost metagenome]
MVASSCTFIMKLPSPDTSTTVRSGQANCAPIAAGRPKPMVPSAPLVRWLRGWLKRQCWATHIWCWPTSQAMIASVGASSLSRFSSAGA